MAEDLVTVFEAATLAEAEAIRVRLEDEGIGAYVEQTASPLDGLSNIGEGTEVMVNSGDTDRALEIIDRYFNEHLDEGEEE